MARLNLIQTGGGGVSGTILWSALGNAGAALTLANAGYATTFNQTSAVAWTWANTTTGTSGTTNSSPLLELAANCWHSGASTQDLWTIGSSLAAGTDGASTLTLAHSGSAGAAFVSIPNISTTTLGVTSIQNTAGAPVAEGVFASADSNTVNVTINLGDTVVVLVSNTDGTTPAGIMDSGGNIYTAFGGNQNTYAGSAQAYYCLNAIYAATSVSFTAGHNPCIAVGTYKNVTSIGQKTGGGSSSSGRLMTYTLASVTVGSYVATLFNPWRAGLNLTSTASQGALKTQQTSHGSPTYLVGVALVSQQSINGGSVPASVYEAAAPNDTSNSFVGYAIELMGNLAAVNIIAPLEISGTAIIPAIIGGNAYSNQFFPAAFGAVGDNSTDDTNALQNCINACQANGGGTVVLGAYTYKTTAALVINTSNVNVIGVSATKSIIQSHTAGADIIQFTGATVGSLQRIVLSDFQVSRSLAPSGTAAGIRVTNNLVMEMIRVESYDSIYCFYFNNIQHADTYKCIAYWTTLSYGLTLYGFYYLATGNNSTHNVDCIVSNGTAASPTCFNSTVYGLYCVGTDGSHEAISDLYCDGFETALCTYGVYLTGYLHTDGGFTGFYNDNLHFVRCIHDQVGCAYSINNVYGQNAFVGILGGYVSCCTSASPAPQLATIDINNSAGVTVTGVQIRGQGAGTYPYGVYIHGANSQNNIVNGCQFYLTGNSGVQPIVLSSTSHNVINNNVINGTSTYNFATGITLASSTYNVIDGNVISGYASGTSCGVSLDATSSNNVGRNDVDLTNIITAVSDLGTLNSVTGSSVLAVFGSDTSLSRLGAASLAVGNGTAGDFTGSLTLGALTQNNNTVATVSTTNASPLHTLSANYWTGAASAADTWTLGTSLVAGTNGRSTLTFGHSGSTGQPQVSLPIGSTTSPAIVGTGGGGTNVGLTIGYSTTINLLSTMSTGSNTVLAHYYYGGGYPQGSITNNTGDGTTGNFQFLGNQANESCDLGISKLPSATLAFPSINFGHLSATGWATTGAGPYVGVNIGARVQTSYAGIYTPQLGWAPTAGAGNFYLLQLAPTINQTGSSSGSYTTLRIAVTETALLGSANKLIDCYAGSAGTTAEFSVDNKGTVTSAGGSIVARVDKGAGYTTTATDYLIAFTATATLVLDSGAAVKGTTYRIKLKASATPGSILTVSPNNSKKIDNAATFVMSVLGQSADVVYDGSTNWDIL